MKGKRLNRKDHTGTTGCHLYPIPDFLLLTSLPSLSLSPDENHRTDWKFSICYFNYFHLDVKYSQILFLTSFRKNENRGQHDRWTDPPFYRCEDFQKTKLRLIGAHLSLTSLVSPHDSKLANRISLNTGEPANAKRQTANGAWRTTIGKWQTVNQGPIKFLAAYNPN